MATGQIEITDGPYENYQLLQQLPTSAKGRTFYTFKIGEQILPYYSDPLSYDVYDVWILVTCPDTTFTIVWDDLSQTPTNIWLDTDIFDYSVDFTNVELSTLKETWTFTNEWQQQYKIKDGRRCLYIAQGANKPFQPPVIVELDKVYEIMYFKQTNTSNEESQISFNCIQNENIQDMPPVNIGMSCRQQTLPGYPSGLYIYNNFKQETAIFLDPFDNTLDVQDIFPNYWWKFTFDVTGSDDKISMSSITFRVGNRVYVCNQTQSAKILYDRKINISLGLPDALLAWFRVRSRTKINKGFPNKNSYGVKTYVE